MSDIQTVFYVRQHGEPSPSGRVRVTTRKPTDETYLALYELHPPRSALEATGEDGVFVIDWDQAEHWPMQVTAH